MRRFLDPTRVGPAPLRLTAAAAAMPLPSSIDFRDTCGPIIDQGAVGDCTACSLAGMLQGLRARAGKPFVAFDVPAIYYEERAMEGDPMSDRGAAIPDGLEVLRTIGAAPASDGPPPDVLETTPPSDVEMADAQVYRIAAWQAIALVAAGTAPQVLVPLLEVLARRIPVEAGIVVPVDLEDASGGFVRMPTRGEERVGGHAVVFVGYRDDASAPGGGWIVFRNSWGVRWGDSGHGYLPYAFVADPQWCIGLWCASLGEEG